MAQIPTLTTDLFPLALGSNVFGWTVDEPAAHRILDTFVAGGGNLIDSADMYPQWVPGNRGGESEEAIGSWLAGRSRDDVLIATKVAKMTTRPGLSPENVRAAADESLARLRTDHIDLYYAHQEDPDTPIERTAEAFDALVRAGKIRAIGVSNFTPQGLVAWMQVAEANGWAKPVAMQPHYNLVHRNDYEDHLAPLADAYGLAVLPYYALAQGFLTGKYRQRVEGGDSPRAQDASRFATGQGLEILDVLDEVAAAHGSTVTTVGLAWLAAQPNVAAPIASASRPEQLADLLAVGSLTLTDDELTRITDVSKWEPSSAS